MERTIFFFFDIFGENKTYSSAKAHSLRPSTLVATFPQVSQVCWNLSTVENRTKSMLSGKRQRQSVYHSQNQIKAIMQHQCTFVLMYSSHVPA
jgi:hypothetical protein